MSSKNTKVSKAITYLLRHAAKKEKVEIDDQGFVTIKDLLAWLFKNGYKTNEKAIKDIVAEDTKNRFTMKDRKIRANQGHSIKLKMTLKDFKQGNSHVVHATYLKNLSGIRKEGLKSMSRNHVHMINVDSKTNKWHMIRQDTNLYAFVKDVKLQESDNGVILTESAHSKNLTLVPAYDVKKSHCYGFIIFNEDRDEVLTVITNRGHHGFPKGKREKGELPLACAFRELNEETNLDPEDIKILPGCISEVNDKGNVPTNYYYAVIKNKKKKIYCKDDDEDLTVKWMNINKLLRLSDEEFHVRRKKLLKS